MQRLSRTKRDIIWTKTPSKPREHTKGWQEIVVQIISKSKPTHDRGQMIEDKSNQHMIESKTHQHMKCDIKRNRIKTTHDR